MQKQLQRSEVPEELTWDLTDIFATEQQWEEELKAVADDIDTVTKYRGRLGEGASVLLACLDAMEDLMKRMSRVAAYARYNMSTDGTSQAYQVAAGRAMSLVARIQGETAFIKSEALSLPAGTLERYLAEDPGLESLRPVIERMIEEKPHTLHPETESVLASLSEVLSAPGTIYRLSKTTDMTFEPVTDSEGNERPMSFGLYSGRYEGSSDAVLRRNGWASFTEGLKAYQNTYGATWATEVKKNVITAGLRGYPSAIDMILSGQQVNRDVYNNIHDTILTELAPHMRRYARLRKKVVGMDKMLYCDIEVPMDPEYQPATSFEQGAEIVQEGLSVLGPEYSEIIRRGVTERWVDLAENIGKSTGAFCGAVPDVHPYILMTWTDSMRNALTLAHELGHGGQGVLSQRYQRLSNSRPTMFFIEAPSTTNEILVGNYITEQSTDVRMRRWVISQLLMTYHHNFVRHLIEGELQRRIYPMAEEGQPITASVLNRVQGQILEDFWGDEVEVDDGARLTWMRQPHYYSGLYPYTYAAGLTIGTAVAAAIEEEGAPAAERWIEVLKAGGTRKPLELAEMAGVDMSRREPIQEAVAFVGSLVDEMEESF